MAESVAYARRGYKGGAKKSTVPAGVGDTATSLTGADLSTWAGVATNGPFMFVLDPGLTTEEVCEATALAGNNITGITRGLRGTGAVTHGPNAVIKHVSTDRDFDEANYLISRRADLLVFNVRAYGALGDGATDDTAAITAAITAAAVNGGTVFFPPGTFIATDLAWPSKVVLRGAGVEATVLKLKNSVNTALLTTTNFATLTGTNGTGGVHSIALRDITLDGNKANNGTAPNLVRIYGYGYYFDNVAIRNGKTYGLYSEWSSSAVSPGTNSMEAHLSSFKVHSCDGGGIDWEGPHDSVWVNGQVFLNTGIGIKVGANGNGVTAVNVHSWGSGQTRAWDLGGTGCQLMNCLGEGASTSQLRITANDCQIRGGTYFGAGAATPVGIEIGVVAGAAPTGTLVDAKILNCTSGAVKFSNDGGASRIGGLVYQASGTVVSGTPAATTALALTVTGVTGSQFKIPEGDVTLGNTGKFVIGDVTWYRNAADQWRTDDAVVIVRDAVAQAFTVFGANDKLNVNTVTNLVEIVNGASLRVYSDGYTTLKFQVDGATGNTTIKGALDHDGTTVGFYNTTPVTKPAATGSRGGNAALASLLTALASQGLITDSTTA